MRTMPSDTEVTVPSLRASAARPTFSMRFRISSLISEGLSVVVAMSVSCRAGLDPPFFAIRSEGRPKPAPRLTGQCGLQALELALQRAVDHHVACVDHR